MPTNPQNYPHINIREIDGSSRPTYGIFDIRKQQKIGEIYYKPKWRKYAFNSYGADFSDESILYIGHFIKELNMKITTNLEFQKRIRA